MSRYPRADGVDHAPPLERVADVDVPRADGTKRTCRRQSMSALGVTAYVAFSGCHVDRLNWPPKRGHLEFFFRSYSATIDTEALTARLGLPSRAPNSTRITIHYCSQAAQVSPFHRKHLRAWRLWCLDTQTPLTRVIPGPHAAAACVMMLSGS
jgi:hypothetical protein